MNCRQIDMDFIRPLATFFYLLDAILIGILIYLFLFHILKLKSGYGSIILPVFLSCLWICLPNNVCFFEKCLFHRPDGAVFHLSVPAAGVAKKLCRHRKSGKTGGY